MAVLPALIVPARLASVRFPRKLLHPVRETPLILHTARRLRQLAPGAPLFFAVAEEELARVLRSEGFEAILTDPDLPSGTDRVAAANAEIGAEAVINVQADEPLVAAAHLEQLTALLATGADMVTLATRFTSADDFRDPNKVKVVCDAHGHARYFSRAPIPWRRDGMSDEEALEGPAPPLWHLGLYGYRADFLATFPTLAPTPLEQTEKLEQLRVLEYGHDIAVGVTETRTIGVDTPADAEALAHHLDSLHLTG